jgi:hypothetical protein
MVWKDGHWCFQPGWGEMDLSQVKSWSVGGGYRQQGGQTERSQTAIVTSKGQLLRFAVGKPRREGTIDVCKVPSLPLPCPFM